VTQQQETELLDAMARCAAGFERAATGNLWRKVGLVTVSVFPRAKRGGFGWCVADGGNKTWSPIGYETEADALDGLVAELAERGLI
jgi:hypothetical protein